MPKKKVRGVTLQVKENTIRSQIFRERASGQHLLWLIHL